MKIVWDPKKAKINGVKHQIHFSDAATVLYDDLALSQPDISAVGEERFVTIGSDALGNILAVVYAYKEDTIRIISARKATKKERQYYESRI